MKKIILVILSLVFATISSIQAQRGCCTFTSSNGTFCTPNVLESDCQDIPGLTAFWVPDPCSCKALPVKFNSFEISLEYNVFNIVWETSQEINNAGFEVEWSNDAITWQKITYVPGKLNSKTISSYKAQMQASLRDNYFRIKQIDTDGKTSYSNVLYSRYINDLDKLIITPNPVANELSLIVSDKYEHDFIEIAIIDVNGSVKIQKSVKNSGYITLNASSLTTGIYFIKISSEKHSEIVKFIKK